VLPANSDPQLSLTITNASAPIPGLTIGLMWFTPGMLLAAGYFVFLYRKFSGKVQLEGGGH
jgi:cytochrome d ubiquinol oxidase subunit II